MKEKGFYYICQNEKCVFRIRTGGKRDLCPFKGCIFATDETAPPYKVLKPQRAEPGDYKNCFFNDKTKCRIKGCIFATDETAPPYKVLKPQRAEPGDYKNCFFNDKTKCRILKSMDCKNKGECVFFKTAKRLIEEDRENARRRKSLR